MPRLRGRDASERGYLSQMFLLCQRRAIAQAPLEGARKKRARNFDDRFAFIRIALAIHRVAAMVVTPKFRSKSAMPRAGFEPATR